MPLVEGHPAAFLGDVLWVPTLHFNIIISAAADEVCGLLQYIGTWSTRVQITCSQCLHRTRGRLP